MQQRTISRYNKIYNWSVSETWGIIKNYGSLNFVIHPLCVQDWFTYYLFAKMYTLKLITTRLTIGKMEWSATLSTLLDNSRILVSNSAIRHILKLSVYSVVPLPTVPWNQIIRRPCPTYIPLAPKTKPCTWITGTLVANLRLKFLWSNNWNTIFFELLCVFI